MGYQTNFILTIVPKKIPRALEEVLEDKFYFYKSGDVWNADSKWYQYNSDMIDLSVSFPKHKFILEGSGEENGDIWISFYKNGKSERRVAEVVLDKSYPTWMTSKEKVD